MRCEVCDGPLNPKGAKHHVCQRCRMDGAEFARSWAEDLRGQRRTWPQVAAIVGLTPLTLRVRVGERRRARAVA